MLIRTIRNKFWLLFLALGLSAQHSFAAPKPVKIRLFEATPVKPNSAPTTQHYWAPALKDAIGTSYEEVGAKSPVWFTLSQGILSEVFYPHVTHPQVGDLQLLFSDGNGFFAEQKRDTQYSAQYAGDGMVAQIHGQEKRGAYKLFQEIVTDPARPVVRIHTTLGFQKPGIKTYLLFKPAVNNSGYQNIGVADAKALVATHANFAGQKPVFVAVLSSAAYTQQSAGLVGVDDGWQDVSKHGRLTNARKQVGPANIALTAELALPQQPSVNFDIAIGFGPTHEAAVMAAQQSLQVPFVQVRAAYAASWSRYLMRLRTTRFGQVQFMQKNNFARRAAQILRMHEDKVYRGAFVAGLSKPGIAYADRASENIGGYHLVWPRDLYQVAMGLLSVGDTVSSVASLRYLVARQKPDGSWHQNFWLDGRPYWSAIQMDQVAFPILLAHQLKRLGATTLNAGDMNMVRRAAEYLYAHGPRTQQDRWEEVGGFVPSSIAAQMAAMRAATLLTSDKKYEAKAVEWSTKLDTWTLVPQGPFGSKYYTRFSSQGNAAINEQYNVANGGGPAMTHETLDGGFLELVRLGVRAPQDPSILSTLDKYDRPQFGLALRNPSGTTYLRYNKDAYGPRQHGGYWPLLAGERGHYAIASGDMPTAKRQLNTMFQSAMYSGHIPEQVISIKENATEVQVYHGLGVPAPLAWSHAEFLKLYRSIEEGKVFDQPF